VLLRINNQHKIVRDQRRNCGRNRLEKLGDKKGLQYKNGVCQICDTAEAGSYIFKAEWEGEAFDQKDMNLPPGIETLVPCVPEVNPNTVIVTQSGTPILMPWHKEARALMLAWYGGNEIGNSTADVVFGDVIPSAKLPLSWPRSLEDNPSYLNFGSTNGRVLYGEDISVL